MFFNQSKFKKVSSLTTASLLVGGLLMGLVGFAQAQDPASYYDRGTVRIVVGFNPGGGYDEYARMIAAELENRIGANVIVENQPGGGGLLALNRLVQAGDDRTMMLAGMESAALAQLTDRPGTRFDLSTLTMLGRAVEDTRVAMWSATRPERTFAEVLNTMNTSGSRWGATGLTDSVSDTTAAMGEALKLNRDQLSIVMGYGGTSDIALAVVRGEVDGVVVSSSSAINYAGDNSMVPLATLSRERDPLFPDTPTIFEVGNLDAEGERWMDFRANITTLGRALVMRGGIDPARAEFLANKIEEVLTDADFLANASATNRPIDFLPANDLNRLIADIFADLSDARKAEVQTVLNEKFIR